MCSVTAIAFLAFTALTRADEVAANGMTESHFANELVDELAKKVRVNLISRLRMTLFFHNADLDTNIFDLCSTRNS